MFRSLIRQSLTLAFIEALTLLFAISWLDLVTGHQVSLVLFLHGPDRFAVWLCDNKSVFIIAGLAGALWSWADIALGHVYLSATVQASEIAIRFAFFFLVAVAGIATKEQHKQPRRALLCSSMPRDSKNKLLRSANMNSSESGAIFMMDSANSCGDRLCGPHRSKSIWKHKA